MTAARCYVRIQGNPVVAVLDSGAAVIMATGVETRALGKINDVKIVIQDAMISSTLQVIESSDETLLLGTDWFQKAKARLHFDE
ncbi:16156_t:CDS:2 [Cetraspora pellucida]|uniref:16156_t:CDS:1 n=1 Tax=Cetraspora pellucida TaxID=1433469 RepID=A0ACA9MZ64_9GLOM|nr:16156_t:CDS:2 [Cetraspora pellucida]